MSKRYSIVGTQFTGTPESFIQGLAVGSDAILVREPDNKYDQNAVAVWIDNKRIGYVPKKQNGELARLIDDIGVSPPAGFAFDSSRPAPKTIPAKFIRSANSGFPMVEVAE